MTHICPREPTRWERICDRVTAIRRELRWWRDLITRRTR